MPRLNSRKKRSKNGEANSLRCQHCHSTQDGRGLRQHERFCAQNPNRRSTINSPSPEPPQKRRHIDLQAPDIEEDMDIDHRMQLNNADAARHGEDDIDMRVDSPDSPTFGPLLPETYIQIIPHPHAVGFPARIISLEHASSSSDSKNTDHHRQCILPVADKPFAPFRTRADFEYAETAVQSLMARHLIDAQIKGINGDWATGHSNITFRNAADLENSVTAARKFVLQFKTGRTNPVMYGGRPHEFEFEYRDPWEYILSLVLDPTLSDVISYHSERKFICTSNGAMETSSEQVIDEPNTAQTWWHNDSSLPASSPHPHCFVPLHVWLDKGMVSSHVKKYPMVIRPAFIPSKIRNASGNGGGMLFAYFPIINDPDDPSARTARETEELRQFRREVYQQIAGIIFESLRKRSWNGEAVKCADLILRILYPGILILSLDGEEAATFCACFGVRGAVPCIKCLVDKLEQCLLMQTFEPRTSDSMQAVVVRAREAGYNAASKKILQSYGLYNINHFLWRFRFSDPYAAVSYDTLHFDESGKFKDHLYPIVLEELERLGNKGKYNQNLADFPRWSGLKHFNHVTTLEIADGQCWLDILKCILLCIVQHLPKDSVLVHAIRALQMYRLLLSLNCMTDSRKRLLRSIIQEYEKCCQKISSAYGKNFNFPKQHAVSHVIDDIDGKGTCKNYSTRPGEGFLQEASQSYEQTNKKDAEHQMVREDERQEAIARIRMAVDSWDAARSQDNEDDDDDLEVDASSDVPVNWTFGSRVPGRKEDSRYTYEHFNEDRAFARFDDKLRAFLIDVFPDENLTYESTLQVEFYRSVHIRYQSYDDWTLAKDIVRCHPKFHGSPRYDNILIHTDTPGLTFARLRALVRVTLPGMARRKVDVVFAHMQRDWFADSKKSKAWAPKTLWKGCRVYEERKEPDFLLMDYVIRGALLAPIPSPRQNIYVLVDCIDGDMLLRSLEA